MITMPFSRIVNCRERFYGFVLVLIFNLLITVTVRAEIVELSITGHWSEKDFKVTSRTDGQYDSANPKFDGTVFGTVPAAGNVTVQLLVNTNGSLFFAKGSEFNAEDGRVEMLTHDFYGYRDVVLVGDAFSFGTAVWRSDGILTGLVGPNSTKVALWTDADITKKDPTRVSFRMFGKADGLMADLFVSSSNQASIRMQFLLWEYYKGEEIRSEKYSVKTKVLRS